MHDNKPLNVYISYHAVLEFKMILGYSLLQNIRKQAVYGGDCETTNYISRN